MGWSCSVRDSQACLSAPIMPDSSPEALVILSPEKSVSVEPHLLKANDLILLVATFCGVTCRSSSRGGQTYFTLKSLPSGVVWMKCLGPSELRQIVNPNFLGLLSESLVLIIVIPTR